MTTNTDMQRKQKPPQEVEASKVRETVVPLVDIYAKEHEIVIEADMPGVGEKDVEIKLENNLLTLSGRVAAQDPREHEIVYREYAPADFERSFTLNDDVDRDGIKARMKNGLLRVVIPKAKEKQPRKIAVEAD
jgi:HSP20 family molecular chaperone IbpA